MYQIDSAIEETLPQITQRIICESVATLRESNFR